MSTSSAPSQLAKTANKHWYFIDSAKGILLILVFVGHLIPYEIGESLTRHIIYSFHMPLFICISGFLFNIEKQHYTVISFIKKYGGRMLLPWTIAVLFYFFNNYLFIYKKVITPGKFLRYFYSPFYHLWYVVGAIGYIAAALVLWKIVKKFRHRWAILFTLALAVGLVSQFRVVVTYFSELSASGLVNANVPKALNIMRIDFKPFYFPMFVFGMYIRNLHEHGKTQKLLKLTPLWTLLFVLAVAADVRVFYLNDAELSDVIKQLMTYPLFLLIYRITTAEKSPRSKLLEFIGQYSLPIYLYHVVCIQLGEKAFGKGTVGDYLLSVGLFIGLLLLVFWLKRYSFINRVFFGSTNSFLTANNKNTNRNKSK